MTSLVSADAVDVALSKRTILHGVSVAVERGEILALVGPNGAGKSTLLGTLAGDLRPQAGRVLFDGEPIDSLKSKDLARRRGLLLQSNQVSFPFHVGRVVEMGRNPWSGTDQSERDDEAVGWAMDLVDVTHLRHRRFSELSGGERARVSLARVLAQDTELLLLDEPTAALDLHHQNRVLGLIRQRAKDGRGVVVVAHDLSLAAALADRVGVLVDGRMLAVGTVQEVMNEDLLSEAYHVPIHVLPGPDGLPIIVPKRGSS
jgi:iron complex transport system ATP-binding protein